MFKRFFLNENFILGVIILNSITILLGAFDNLSPAQTKFITTIDNVITVIFVIEMVVKIMEFKIGGYFSSNWNKLDCLLVLLSIPALISWIFDLSLSSLSFFLIFRVLRVFKSFRFLKFVPGITDLIKGVQRALKTSVVIILGFCIYIFIIGIFSTYLFQNIAPEHFSNPLTSFYSIFKIFTVEGWYEIPEQITANTDGTVSFFSKLYFVFILVTGGIFGLSLVNSIFVEAMLSDNTDDISQKIDKLEDKLDNYLRNKG
ncbi:ion transporter [Marinilabilia salmonicolor]|uniref:ion transporter n=1 Tax=Marinilabilia salmonicolor TaxID=989 RepID=UPI00029AC77D|nr:ion transporter [Marinilabilia salmonicolor]